MKYLTGRIKATVATPYLYFFPKTQKRPRIQIKLPEFVIPQRIELDRGDEGEDENPLERVLLMISNRAQESVAAERDKLRRVTRYADDADERAKAYFAKLDRDNRELLRRPWLDNVRTQFRAPLVYI